MKHTPGPWTVTVRRGRVIVLDANRNEVCDAFAAAPLIAAAPDLLAALGGMIDWLDDGNRQLSDACANDVAKARAAIAQATGDA